MVGEKNLIIKTLGHIAGNEKKKNAEKDGLLAWGTASFLQQTGWGQVIGGGGNQKNPWGRKAKKRKKEEVSV